MPRFLYYPHRYLRQNPYIPTSKPLYTYVKTPIYLRQNPYITTSNFPKRNNEETLIDDEDDDREDEEEDDDGVEF